ncbi:hypothetical protein EDB92DRAFT_1816062 [Lactarius akahatsu]|uniref:Uncharacterized protein n=1 Tax=Lactarius akahatsu TaxID=416441 RepID=A0AAD4LHP1_9AGAM|nr:hypothetical protein EDB92DRAFT_1816062 [Lactarius akahatsu]
MVTFSCRTIQAKFLSGHKSSGLGGPESRTVAELRSSSCHAASLSKDGDILSVHVQYELRRMADMNRRMIVAVAEEWRGWQLPPWVAATTQSRAAATNLAISDWLWNRPNPTLWRKGPTRCSWEVTRIYYIAVRSTPVQLTVIFQRLSLDAAGSGVPAWRTAIPGCSESAGYNFPARPAALHNQRGVSTVGPRNAGEKYDRRAEKAKRTGEAGARPVRARPMYQGANYCRHPSGLEDALHTRLFGLFSGSSGNRRTEN